MNKNEIELRIEALKATGVSGGAESTNKLWIILHENTKTKQAYGCAIPLRELLGDGEGAVSEESMKQHFGGQWRGKFTKQRGIGKGFITRTMNNCVFVSIDDGTARNDFPNSGNIIKRGDTEVGAVHHFIEKVVTSSKEAGANEEAGAVAADEDAMDMEEEEGDATRGPASADDLESATLQHIFNFLRLDDTRQTPAGVSRKWRQASKAVVPCKDDYLETLREDHIPSAIAIFGRRKNNIDLSHIFTLVQQNTSLQNAIGDQAIKLRLVDAPTIENCLQLLDRAVDNAVENDKEVSPAVQSFMHRTLLKLQQQHEKKMEEAEEQQQQQLQQQQQRRRHRQQQQVIPIKYFDNGNRIRTCTLQVRKNQRSCGSTSTDKAKQEYIRQIAVATGNSME